ncbi:MAG TPA: hypothetical protein VK168_04945 [Saprospiraceae bacterium]|nr:hypothetical protein [Saprospiraceae bacterium]
MFINASFTTFAPVLPDNMTGHMRFLLFLLVSIVLLTACGNEDEIPRPDISDVKINFKLERFEQDIFALDTTQLQTGMEQLLGKYPMMLPLFCNEIIHDQSNPAETPRQALAAFLATPQIKHIYDTVQQVYGNLDWLEKDLTQMFRYYKYYFPEKPTPQVVTMISEFATDAFTAGDSLCGIGLDLFLGENYPGYDPDVFPAFMRRQFKKEYIPVRLAKAVAQNSSDGPSGQRLLDIILHNGKELYLVDCLLPEVPDSMKMGYTAEQMGGCYANEAEVWARLLSEKLLYSTDYDKFRKLVSPSPNAPIVFSEAPGEIGNWVGLRIVKAYMKRYPKTTMKELFQMTDSQKFLELAKYKPKRD